MTYDPAHPLAIMPGETVNGNQALTDYWALGPERSYTQLAEAYAQRNANTTQTPSPPTRAKSAKIAREQIARWGGLYHWQERIQQQGANELAQVQKIMQERRAAAMAQKYELGQQAIKLAEEGLRQGAQFVSTSRRLIKGKDGQPDKEIITLRMDARSVIAMLDAGIDLIDEATGLDAKQGTPDNPVHTVTESRDDWEARALARAIEAARTLGEDDDADSGQTGAE